MTPNYPPALNNRRVRHVTRWMVVLTLLQAFWGLQHFIGSMAVSLDPLAQLPAWMSVCHPSGRASTDQNTPTDNNAPCPVCVAYSASGCGVPSNPSALTAFIRGTEPVSWARSQSAPSIPWRWPHVGSERSPPVYS